MIEITKIQELIDYSQGRKKWPENTNIIINLCLEEGKVGCGWIDYLVSMIDLNRIPLNIIEINLSKTNLRDYGTEVLFAAIKSSKRLTNLRKLDLSNNNIQQKGAIIIANFLQSRHELLSLQYIDLSNNQFFGEYFDFGKYYNEGTGAQQLSNAIKSPNFKSNICVQLSDNPRYNDTVPALLNALTSSHMCPFNTKILGVSHQIDSACESNNDMILTARERTASFAQSLFSAASLLNNLPPDVIELILLFSMLDLETIKIRDNFIHHTRTNAREVVTVVSNIMESRRKKQLTGETSAQCSSDVSILPSQQPKP